MDKSTRESEITLDYINTELAEVLKSGKYALGSDKAMKALLNNEAMVIVITRKIPPKIRCDFEYHTMVGKIKLIQYPGNTIELKSADDKKLRVSVLAVTCIGNSNIMELLSSSGGNKSYKKIIN